MGSAQGLLAIIKGLVSASEYRIRIHAVRHMIEEGFDEENLLAALEGKAKSWRIILARSGA